jgi:hypothetical protein
MDMTDPNSSPQKVPPFLPLEPPIHPRPNGKPKRVSERGLLSLVTTVISVFSLLVMMTGWLKLTLDIFDLGLTKVIQDGLWSKVIALALAFLFGWLAAVLSIRTFGNLVLPLIISGLTWIVLAGIAALYIAILSRLFDQGYATERFWGYMLMMGSGVLVLVGLHLIPEGHDLRPHAIPLLVIAMGQLFVIVYRYVFTTGANSKLLIYDILFFVTMITVSSFMVAHVGILAPIRRLISKLFDHNLSSPRPQH